jgi:prepilin-type N-terminal cleavage/methylation domain-containing protein
MFKQINNKKAFTLIELLVVISIIGLLSTLAVTSLSRAKAKARDAKRMSDLKTVSKALEFFYLDNGYYPTESYGDVTSCDNNEVIAFYDDVIIGDFALCPRTTFKKGSNLYMTSLPVTPTPNQGYYYYGPTTSFEPPCVFSYDIESYGSNYMFWCRGGNCQLSNGSTFCG